MVKAILGGLALVIVLALIYAATKPDTFRVERSISIKAPAEKIFPLINDFHRWEQWSPWEKVDPALKRTYSGADSGVGAAYAWFGNKEIGQGRMEIIESTPPARLLIKIDFLAPFEAHNTVEFTLTRQGDSTVLSHAMFGPSPYLAKLMGLVFSMDKMVGDKFEEGLGSLKAIAEAQ
ncbi:SRPBCC family protein [Dechloromonas sp. A34]|uniref:SRPBCC family protein n=1 Tax=Dechloromonas sp. A34 TaxID=447588 RepID=UPI002248898C|nr:SRPBCC family protein [Dechloromonas sp. A34]